MHLASRLCAILLVLVSACRSNHHDSGDSETPGGGQFGNTEMPTLLFSFAGKGTQLAWDIGAMWATVEHLSVPEKQVILAGNSSGSILASYFACHSLKSASIARARDLILGFDRFLVNENKGKFSAAVFNTDPSYPHSNITPFLDKILVECDEPTSWRPLAIVAANNDVLEMRRNQPGFRGFDKVFDYRTNNVSMPGLFVGKACTYFVNPAMFEIMNQVPYAERLCDIRMMTTLLDVKTAMLASVSEPTYFPPVVEMEPEKIVDVRGMAPRQRWYNGGFIMNILAQDIKRPLPFLRVLGTGRSDLSSFSVRYVQKRYLADMELLTQIGKWWLDLELLPSEDEADAMDPQRTPHQTIMAMGCRRAHYCLNQDKCYDPKVVSPYFRAATASAGGALVPRGQGLGHLLKPANSMVQTCPY